MKLTVAVGDDEPDGPDGSGGVADQPRLVCLRLLEIIFGEDATSFGVSGLGRGLEHVEIQPCCGIG